MPRHQLKCDSDCVCEYNSGWNSRLNWWTEWSRLPSSMWWPPPNQLVVCIEPEKKAEKGRICYLCLSWSCGIVLFCPWNVAFSIPGSQAFRLRLYYSINSPPFQRVESITSQSPLLYGPISHKKLLYMNIYLPISSYWFFSSGEPWWREPLFFVCWLKKRRYDLTASLKRTISFLISSHSPILLLPWREGAERNYSRGILLGSLSWGVKFFRIRGIVV